MLPPLTLPVLLLLSRHGAGRVRIARVRAGGRVAMCRREVVFARRHGELLREEFGRSLLFHGYRASGGAITMGYGLGVGGVIGRGCSCIRLGGGGGNI